MRPWIRDPAASRPSAQSYAVYLPDVSMPALKRMARLWVGAKAFTLNKDACLWAIYYGLTDPAAVQRVVAGLSDFERAGLGLLKHHGRAAQTDVLAAELFMLGLPFEAQHDSPASWVTTHGADYRALNTLLHHGLILPRRAQKGYGYPTELYMDGSHYSPQVFSESSLLDEVETVPPVPLALHPVSAVEPGRVKQPSEVVRLLIAALEALRSLGPIPLTPAGRPPAPFLARLTTRLGVDTTLAQDPLAPLPDATAFLFWLLAGLRMYQLTADGQSLELSPRATTAFQVAYEVQAMRWVRAYRGLSDWQEASPEGAEPSALAPAQRRTVMGARAALLLALGALPNPTAWYHIAALAEAIAARWQRRITPWIRQAILGPLVHLGLLETAREVGESPTVLSLFRLTPLGRAVLYDALRGRRVPTTEPGTGWPAQEVPCWIVQPNFEIVVYLDRASPTQLAWLERVAERRPAVGATALYHLTRETVYAALEVGQEAATLGDTLRQASIYPVPENVCQALDEWAARRERLTVYRTVDVLEFADQAARDTAHARDPLLGQPLGSRFLLSTAPAWKRSDAFTMSRVYDYSVSPVPCLLVAEDGAVQLQPAEADLLVHGELAAWAEPRPDPSQWRLTPTSMARAVRAGWSPRSLTVGLAQRALQPVPALLLVALRAWAGDRDLPRATALAVEPILHVADPDIAQAIAASTLLKPYLRGQLGPQTFLVHARAVSALQQQLTALGLSVGRDLLLTPAP